MLSCSLSPTRKSKYRSELANFVKYKPGGLAALTLKFKSDMIIRKEHCSMKALNQLIQVNHKYVILYDG